MLYVRWWCEPKTESKHFTIIIIIIFGRCSTVATIKVNHRCSHQEWDVNEECFHIIIKSHWACWLFLVLLMPSNIQWTMTRCLTMKFSMPFQSSTTNKIRCIKPPVPLITVSYCILFLTLFLRLHSIVEENYFRQRWSNQSLTAKHSSV